jgi:hypothetical protein
MISNSGTSTLGLYDFKRQVDAFGGVDYFRPNLAGGYLKNARVMLANGDIVKSTIDGNANDPNVDMTGWVSATDASFVVDGDKNQKQINNTTIRVVQSIASLADINNPKSGQVVYVKSYHLGLDRGGRKVTYDPSRSSVNDGIFIFNGWVSESILNLSPDHAGAKPNNSSFDNTEALNKVFATGQNIYGYPDDVYHVTGSIRTKGQRTIGGWKIHSVKATSRAGVWDKLVTTSDTGLDTSNNIRMLYVSSAWDLSEFLAIKALGFNTIHHYVGMSDMGWDWDGDVFDVLNNAKTAGLKVSLGTEQDPNAVADLSAWISSVDSHLALWAYSVYDEPAARGFTVAQQDARIATMRGLTNKNLIMVDYESNPFVQNYSTEYDIVFVNSYSKKWSSYDPLAQDLDKMRRDYGVLKAQIGTHTIPCVGSFAFSGSLYADNITQIVNSARIFGTVANGDFAAFVWDGEADAQITAAVRDNTQLQSLVMELCNQVLKKPVHTDVYLFGNAATQTDWGLRDILDRISKPDPVATDGMTINSYPVKVSYGAANTDRESNISTLEYAGVAFKGSDAKLTTGIKLRKYLKTYLEYVNIDGDVPNSTIELCSTYDGYNLNTEVTIPVEQVNSIIQGSYIISRAHKTSLVFKFMNRSAVIKDKYRQLVRGVIICSDW